MAVLGWHDWLARNRYGCADHRFITILGRGRLADTLYRSNRSNRSKGSRWVARALSDRRLLWTRLSPAIRRWLRRGLYGRVFSYAANWVFVAPENCFCQAVHCTGSEGVHRPLRVSSRERLVAVLSEVIRWHQNGFSGGAALIRMIKIIVQAAAFLSAQGGPDN